MRPEKKGHDRNGQRKIGEKGGRAGPKDDERRRSKAM